MGLLYITPLVYIYTAADGKKTAHVESSTYLVYLRITNNLPFLPLALVISWLLIKFAYLKERLKFCVLRRKLLSQVDGRFFRIACHWKLLPQIWANSIQVNLCQNLVKLQVHKSNYVSMQCSPVCESTIGVSTLAPPTNPTGQTPTRFILAI